MRILFFLCVFCIIYVCAQQTTANPFVKKYEIISDKKQIIEEDKQKEPINRANTDEGYQQLKNVVQDTIEYVTWGVFTLCFLGIIIICKSNRRKPVSFKQKKVQ
jgi:lipopolysaccharide/colanic/teichoic acid biosynthesis glycosyltransferase